MANTRISTGNAHADEILNGGFPANSINIVMGEPGTGKTVFAELLAFHNATDDKRPSLYLTTLSEPVAKIVKYLQRFQFFDEEKIGSSIHYEDIGTELAKHGISALIPLLKESLKIRSPKIIIIDSFKALHDLAESTPEMRRMLFELTGLLTAYETTVFLLGEYTDEEAKTLPEFALVDGIIQFMRSAHSTRDERFLRVLKLRGSNYIEGLHGFRITSQGLDIYPRLVTPEIPENYVIVQERTPSGIDGLDKMIGGGLWKGSSTLLAGSTGAGKTTLSLQFAIEGTRQGVQSLYVNFQENPTQLARSIVNLSGRSAQETLESGLNLLYISPVEVQLDSVVVRLFRLIREKNIKRVVIDSIGDLARSASDPQRFNDYLYATFKHLAVQGITAMFTIETGDAVIGPANDLQLDNVGGMSDNMITLSLKQQPVPHRELVCSKSRGSEQDLAPHEFFIAQDGLHIR